MTFQEAILFGLGLHLFFNDTPLMGRWDSGRLVDLDPLDNPEPSHADKKRLLWTQNGPH